MPIPTSYKSDESICLEQTEKYLHYLSDNHVETVMTTAGTSQFNLLSNYEAITRNNYLHFDRSRCMKSLVYLEDTDEDCGPFTIVKKSHRKGNHGRRNIADKKSDS